MNIVFVCHGNICRSVAAEIIARKMFPSFDISSKATSFEEIGNDIYPPMKKALLEKGYDLKPHQASRIERDDFLKADYVIYMDDENYANLVYRFGNNPKIIPIYKFSKDINEIEDPWYTRRFSLVVTQIEDCLKDLKKFLF